MSENNNLIQVRSLVDHIVVIPDPEMHRKYTFQPYETKNIDKETLRRLAYRYGVLYLFRNSLCVEDAELKKEFGSGEDVIEYNWTAKDVDKCLLYGSLDELLDALDYGPEGIKDTLAQRAVELKINDVSKRKAIQEKTGKNITSMIDLTEQYNAAVGIEDNTDETPKKRRVSSGENKTSGRRVQKSQE